MKYKDQNLKFKFKVRINRGEIYLLYVGRVRAVSSLCVLFPGICLTTDRKSREETSVSVVEKCQVGTIQCVDMTTCYGLPGQGVDPGLLILGVPGHRSVSVDIYRAA
jgi:hypothetical protein